eukprot:233879-Pyramimonas_sp.AAC.1
MSPMTILGRLFARRPHWRSRNLARNNSVATIWAGDKPLNSPERLSTAPQRQNWSCSHARSRPAKRLRGAARRRGLRPAAAQRSAESRWRARGHLRHLGVRQR